MVESTCVRNPRSSWTILDAGTLSVRRDLCRDRLKSRNGGLAVESLATDDLLHCYPTHHEDRFDAAAAFPMLPSSQKVGASEYSVRKA